MSMVDLLDEEIAKMSEEEIREEIRQQEKFIRLDSFDRSFGTSYITIYRDNIRKLDLALSLRKEKKA